MAQSFRKYIPRKKRSSPGEKQELVPLRFTLDEELYAILAQIADQSGKSVSEVAAIFLERGLDQDKKIDARVERAVQQIAAEDIARRLGPLLTFLSPLTKKRTASN